MCLSVLPSCMYVTVCVPGACRGQKNVLDSLELVDGRKPSIFIIAKCLKELYTLFLFKIYLCI